MLHLRAAGDVPLRAAGPASRKGLADENIYMSLERRMKCGVGKCGHCQINHSYVCQDGPVYHYPDIKSLQEAL